MPTRTKNPAFKPAASKLAGAEAIVKQAAGVNAQQPAGEQEQWERAAARRTTGRKGCRMPRFVVSFTPDNHSFLKLMASVTGVSMGYYVNWLIEQHRKEYPELWRRAQQLEADVFGYSQKVKGETDGR